MRDFCFCDQDFNKLFVSQESYKTVITIFGEDKNHPTTQAQVEISVSVNEMIRLRDDLNKRIDAALAAEIM